MILLLPILHALWLLVTQKPWYMGMSFDSALLALWLPVFFFNFHPVRMIFAFFVFSASLWFAGVTTYMIFGFYLFVFIATTFPKYLWVFVFPTAAGIFVLVNNWYDESLRFDMWQEYFMVFNEKALPMNGFGLGQWDEIGPLIPVRGKRYIWAHNDWLLLLLETGWIGLCAVLSGFVLLLKKLWKAEVYGLLLAMGGFGVCMLTYSPLQVTYGQLTIIYLLYEVWNSREGIFYRT